jgi:LmbE family N-acetylglucosaminyl deacetylase
MNEHNGQKQVMLAVLAHPDDESFGMGGTLALYAQQGVDVYLVCATGGEVGMMDPELMHGFETIAERREYELRCAAKQLGLRDIFLLGYRDSGMPGTPENENPQALVQAPFEQVVGQVVRPQVMITFDPIGGYKHPDHIYIHKATVAAFEAAGEPQAYLGDLPPYQPQKLYYHTISRGFLRMAVRVLPLFGKDPSKWGHNHDIDLTDLAAVQFPVHAVIDYGPVRERKERASECHASQGGSAMIRGLMGWVMRLARSRETFMRAYPEPQDGKVEHDLFAGVD